MLKTKKRFEFEINELNLYKIMNPGYDDATREHIKEGLKLIIPKVEEVINPIVHYAYKEDRIYVFASLGSEAEDIGKSLWSENEYFNAMLLDNYLTQYLFDLSRAVYRELKQEVLLTNKGLGKRQTPGDEIPLSVNKEIIDILKSFGEFEGSYNESFALTPAKSLAYFYAIEDAYSCLDQDLSCQNCNRETCLMR